MTFCSITTYIFLGFTWSSTPSRPINKKIYDKTIYLLFDDQKEPSDHMLSEPPFNFLLIKML